MFVAFLYSLPREQKVPYSKEHKHGKANNCDRPGAVRIRTSVLRVIPSIETESY